MKLVLASVFALLTLQPALNAREPQRPKAILEGVVARAGSGQPVAGARVTLISGIGFENVGPLPSAVRDRVVGGAAAETDIAPVMTDNQGRFAFQVDEGRYIVRVQANGYVPQNYSQRLPKGTPTVVVLTSGQTTRNINISLTAAANISGRVRDEGGRPVANVPVQLLHYSYDEKGERAFQTSLTAVRTNDRGEYRMYWVTPGTYYVLAGRPTVGRNPMSEMMMLVLSGGTPSGSRVPLVTGYAFYPGVIEISNARPVDLQPGAELQAIDVALNLRPKTYAIRGKLVDAATGQPPAQANVFVTTKTPGLSSDGIESQLGMSSRNYDGKTGRFEIRDLLPGAYTVMAIVDDPAAATRRGAPIPSNGMFAVSISSGDVEEILVSVSPVASIAGRLRIEGQLPGTATLDQLRVSLRPAGPNRAAQQTMQTHLSRSAEFYWGADTRSDGTFRIDYLIPGEYRLEVGGGLDAYGFVREARFDGADVLNNPLRFSTSTRGDMDVVVVVGGGRVAGAVTDVRSQALSGVRVVLVPDRARQRVDLYRAVVTDSNGRFFIAPVAPGDYKLFAWESIEEFAWFDPDVLARFESRGRNVHITESSNETIDLRVIPVDGAR